MSDQTEGARWNYSGKAALVVGGSSGIGLAIANRLLASGARVAVAARRPEGLEAFEAKSSGAGIGIATDDTQSDQVERMVRRTVDAFGRLDVTFNVAGIVRLGSIVDLPEDVWDSVHDSVLRSTFVCIKHQARQMIKQGAGGAIVNITSVSAQIPARGAAAYATAKAGMEMLTRVAALELSEHSIRVNALSPGLVATPLTEQMLAVPGVHDAYMERIPLGTAADPRDIAGPALFLGSSEASYITGASLVADGGWTLTGYPDLRSYF